MEDLNMSTTVKVDPWSGLGLRQQAFQKYVNDNGIKVSTEYGSAFLAAKLAFVSGWDAHANLQANLQA